MLVHIAIILSWLGTSSYLKKITPNDKVLFLIATPPQKPLVEVALQKAIVKAKPTSPTRLTDTEKINKSQAITAKIQTPAQIQVPTPESETPTIPSPLQKNIRELSLSLKDDFLKQEKNFRPDSKSSTETMKNFSNALADAAQIPREGIVIEKKFAYDGRPVSKVKTPFGTYCVRHPKAGEKLELSPPPIAVTCGQL
ncbi:hypothetical protein [Undibacterium sp.]|uniref:hypothetical protein n=1 Tax=Undibacterium sp. TaxID=1914977 RepID=UPI0037510CC0